MGLLSHLRKWKRRSHKLIEASLHAAALLLVQLPFLHADAFSSCSCLFFMQVPSLSYSCLFFMQVPSLSYSCLFFMQLCFLHAAAFSYSAYPCKVSWSPDQFATVDISSCSLRSCTCDCLHATSRYALLSFTSYQMSRFSGLPPPCSLTGQGFTTTKICCCWQSQVSIFNVQIWGKHSRSHGERMTIRH